MRTPRSIFLICLCVFSIAFVENSMAQIGGYRTFEFLNKPYWGKSIALGGNHLTASDQDAFSFVLNPSLLKDDHQRMFAISYTSGMSGISHSALSYAFNTEKLGMIGASMLYTSYGPMVQTDIYGNEMGDLNASQYAFTLTKSKKIDAFSMGAALTFASSQLGAYGSSGLFLTISGTFEHPEKDLKVGMSFNNLGFAFSSFTPSSEMQIPFDVRLGVSYKPEKMPFRFHFSTQNWNRSNIAYNDPSLSTQLDAFGNPIQTQVSGTDKFFRHFVIGGEFVLHKSFQIRAGYSFLRRKEGSLEDRPATVGFSYGFLIRGSKWEFSFARQSWFLMQALNNFTLALNTKTLFSSSIKK